MKLRKRQRRFSDNYYIKFLFFVKKKLLDIIETLIAMKGDIKHATVISVINRITGDGKITLSEGGTPVRREVTELWDITSHNFQVALEEFNYRKELIERQGYEAFLKDRYEDYAYKRF